LEAYFKVVRDKDKKPFTKEQIEEMLLWKYRKEKEKLKNKNLLGVIRKAKSQINTINLFKENEQSEEWFDKTSNELITKQPVTRIFLKHMCKPDKFAIFDRFVLKSFLFLHNINKKAETPTPSDERKYYKKYNEFFKEVCKEKNKESLRERKEIDNALMYYGKYCID